MKILNTKMKNNLPQWHDYDMGNGVIAFSTTRKGGCSEGNYAAFNINRYCGDDPAHIEANRTALCQRLGIGMAQLVVPHQVHAAEVKQIGRDFTEQPAVVRDELTDGFDAVMTDVPGICVGVSTADCIPVLIYDAAHHAVCAVHAGWRGTVQRIVVKAIERMRAAYGTQPSELTAASMIFSVFVFISCCIFRGNFYTSGRFHKGRDRCVQLLEHPFQNLQEASYPGVAGGWLLHVVAIQT